MRALPLVLCLVLLAVRVVAEPLTASDREALLENLDKLRGIVTERVDSRFRAAIVAYRGGMASDGAALEFYLKCVDKVKFEDQYKKAADFREWKKKEEAKLSETSLRRALVYQLRWLVLTLQAASENADRAKIVAEAQQQIDEVMHDAGVLTNQSEVLSQNVIGTVFAKAYEVGAIDLEQWAYSPYSIGEAYEQIILPAYRAGGDVNALRACWIKRITQEGVLHEPASAKVKTNSHALAPESNRSAGMKKFLAETQPSLQWMMEKDLFRCGDQRGAAVRMVAHIEKHLAHPNVRDWGDELKAMLAPQVSAHPAVVTPAQPVRKVTR